MEAQYATYVVMEAQYATYVVMEAQYATYVVMEAQYATYVVGDERRRRLKDVASRDVRLLRRRGDRPRRGDRDPTLEEVDLLVGEGVRGRA